MRTYGTGRNCVSKSLPRSSTSCVWEELLFRPPDSDIGVAQFFPYYCVIVVLPYIESERDAA